MIKAVVFDVGETLIDDTRGWRTWADWLGVPFHTLSALVGAVTVGGRDNADALRIVRPGIDVASEWQAREAAGQGEMFDEDDLYPDVRPALTMLKKNGLWIGVAGNQTSRAAELLRALKLPADAIATSGQWGLTKPAPEFFARIIDWAPGAPEEIVYVGDHRDNDIIPAKAAGLRTALVRRGPWGYLWADDSLLRQAADWRVDHLTELAGLLAP